MSEPVRAVDLFCGAGGLSFGLALACEQLEREVELTAVNHWERAIETHERNHPWATQYNAKVEELSPRAVVDGEVKILTGGPECTHFSTARGGKPVDEQKRASPWHVLDWVSKLLPEGVLLENVPEFESWGPVLDGEPTRNGKFFEAWVETFRGLGYSVSWRVLNAADYGDATSRRRLFIVARRGHQPAWPDPSHSEDGEKPCTEQWRPAAEVIDWSDPGTSIWTRDLEEPRVHNPPKDTTMQRIAEGVRRHCHDRLEPFADALASLGREDIRALREDVVGVEDVAAAVDDRDEPFLVRGSTPAVAADGGQPAENVGLCVPYLLGQQSGARPRDATDRPCPTVASSGAISKIEPQPFVLPRNGAQRGLHSNATYDPDQRPLHVVTAQNHDGHLVTPFLVEYYGESTSADVDEPLPTVTTRDRHALIVPEAFPWGLDLGFRMLKPVELAQAMGFPADYEFVGNKGETVEQIGNAVPVNLASALCERLLMESEPTLGGFTDGTQEVAESDD